MEGVIIFADDHIYSQGRPEAALYEALRKEIPTLGMHNLDLVRGAVKSIGAFKAVVLDWQFTQENAWDDIEKELGTPKIKISVSSKEDETLNFLETNDFYSLIYVFSEIDIQEKFGERLTKRFGDRIRIQKKGDEFSNNPTAFKDKILKEIQEWDEKHRNLSIPIQWSATINESLQIIFKELSEAKSNWISEVYDSAAGDGVDPTLFVIDILHQLLDEAVIQNPTLIGAIKAIGGTKNNDAIESDQAALSKLFNRLIYSSLKMDAPIMTGDVCQLDARTYGVIISPECDVNDIYESAGLDDELQFELLKFTIGSIEEHPKKKELFPQGGKAFTKVNDKNKGNLRKLFNQEEPRYHLLAAIRHDDENCDLTCLIDFKKAPIRKNASEIKGLRRPYKVNSPYIQQLRQRYLSYIGRVGVPALPQSVKDWNLVRGVSNSEATAGLPG